MGDWITGLLEGFNARRGEVEERNLREGLASRQREAAVLQTLSQSPDPEVRTLAIAGMLDSASPAKRKSGLSGWLGQLQSSPHLDAIRRLSPTVQRTQTVPDVPTQQGYLPDLPQGTALPAANPTQGGGPLRLGQVGPPPAPPEATDLSTGVEGRAEPRSPITPDMRTLAGQIAPRSVQLTTEQPRTFLPSAADLAREQAGAKAAGDVEGEVVGLEAAGFSPEDARALVRQSYMRRAAGSSAAPFQAVAGETLVNGQWQPTYGTYDRTTGTWRDPNGQALTSFRKGSSTPNLKQTREVLARQLFGKDLPALSSEEIAQVVEAETALIQEQSFARRLGQGEGSLASPVTPQVSAQTGLPIGVAGSAAAGQVVGTAPQRETRRTLGAVRAEIESRIKPLLAVLPRQGDFGGTLAPGAVLAARRRTNPQVQQQVAALDAALNSVKTTLARARGDTRLSNADINRIDAALVSLEFDWSNPLGGDSQETATARLNETLSNLDIVLASLPPEVQVELGTAPPGPGTAGTTTPAPRTPPPPATRPAAPRPSARPTPPPSPLDQPAPVSGTGARYVIRNGQLVREGN